LFDKNNYEVALDEGLANEANFFTIFYGERTPYWFTVTAKGNVGHGSQFIKETAIEKLVRMINKALNFRKE
jgi:aminoacylase